MEGKRLSEVFPPELAASLEPHYRAALAGDTLATQQVINDETYQVQFAPVRDEQNVIHAGLLLLQNITERQRADDALRASEARYRLMAENSSELISIQTREDVYVDASPAARLLIG